MSQFIDYTKRSVTLPPGCKDLMDVLRLDEVRSGDPAALKGNKAVKGRLSETGKYVGRLFRSKAVIIFLMMTAPDERFTIELVRAFGATRMFSVKFVYDLDREDGVRAFFKRHRLKLSEKTEIPGHFSPHLPVQCLYAITPLPSDPAAISGLATELFREVAGLDDEAEIQFRYHERTKPF